MSEQQTDDGRTVSPDQWRTAVAEARAQGYDFFDWLGAVDQIGRSDDFEVLIRLVDLDRGRAVLLRTAIPRDAPQLDSVADLFAGAGWHERESGELFAITFVGGDPRRLLLPDDFVGAPLRKDAVLAARAGIEWPGAKEPGGGVVSPANGAASRRRMMPPGVPEPEIWGDRDPEAAQPDAAEVAESAVGGRMRRRRPLRQAQDTALRQAQDNASRGSGHRR